MTIKPRTSSETVLLVRESVAGMILEVKDACPVVCLNLMLLDVDWHGDMGQWRENER
jgi:hypothetical protein